MNDSVTIVYSDDLHSKNSTTENWGVSFNTKYLLLEIIVRWTVPVEESGDDGNSGSEEGGDVEGRVDVHHGTGTREKRVVTPETGLDWPGGVGEASVNRRGQMRGLELWSVASVPIRVFDSFYLDTRIDSAIRLVSTIIVS